MYDPSIVHTSRNFNFQRLNYALENSSITELPDSPQCNGIYGKELEGCGSMPDMNELLIHENPYKNSKKIDVRSRLDPSLDSNNLAQNDHSYDDMIEDQNNSDGSSSGMNQNSLDMLLVAMNSEMRNDETTAAGPLHKQTLERTENRSHDEFHDRNAHIMQRDQFASRPIQQHTIGVGRNIAWANRTESQPATTFWKPWANSEDLQALRRDFPVQEDWNASPSAGSMNTFENDNPNYSLQNCFLAGSASSSGAHLVEDEETTNQARIRHRRSVSFMNDKPKIVFSQETEANNKIMAWPGNNAEGKVRLDSGTSLEFAPDQLHPSLMSAQSLHRMHYEDSARNKKHPLHMQMEQDRRQQLQRFHQQQYQRYNEQQPGLFNQHHMQHPNHYNYPFQNVQPVQKPLTPRLHVSPAKAQENNGTPQHLFSRKRSIANDETNTSAAYHGQNATLSVANEDFVMRKRSKSFDVSMVLQPNYSSAAAPELRPAYAALTSEHYRPMVQSNFQTTFDIKRDKFGAINHPAHLHERASTTSAIQNGAGSNGSSVNNGATPSNTRLGAPQKEIMDPEAHPRRQRIRYPNDLYTPQWVRFTGQAKEGFCDTCDPGKWLQLKNSAFWYHKQFYHGISSVSGQPFLNPLEHRIVDQEVVQGLCHQCNEWVVISNSKRKNTVLWFRHAHKCHIYTKPKPLANPNPTAVLNSQNQDCQ